MPSIETRVDKSEVIVLCHTLSNSWIAKLAKALARFCPEPSQMALLNSEVPQKELRVQITVVLSQL
ncbi:hypothetical protein GCM10007932_22990 [Vibrio penaeicida]|uniref:Uncharacterized protein n=1 Tax=Vibrio penaeicida TaxID=104609 RepID=A0AAV5NQV2_9VIBR|nr:hypothetical protein GCM10007932_22990 [Vibrio penaeicida]